MQQVDVQALYSNLNVAHQQARKTLGTALTLTEKIIWSHLHNPQQGQLERGKSFVLLKPDRVAMQDATAQMAILQFMQAQKSQVAVPATIHCDHLIQAFQGAQADLSTAEHTNHEVYNFLCTAANKYGMGFWKPGSGIIHQIVLENYAFPGGLMIGTDSHTPNAGGLGMMAIGVGGADAVDVLVGMPWEVLYPKIIGVKLTGKLNGWTSGKDIILKLLELLTVKGGTNKVIEYFGPGVESLSCTAQATATNMGAELGATCSVFPYHAAMGAYLAATRRIELKTLADQYKNFLCADPEVYANPHNYYDQIIEINLDTLEPYIVGPHSPDLARPLSKMATDVVQNQYPDPVKVGLIGSCTNSSYEDIARASSLAKQALNKGLKSNAELLITPGSDQVYATAEKDGYLQILRDAGAVVMSNACGPCIGQWKRTDVTPGEANSIISSFNRNFPARNDGNKGTLSFISSPEIVMALSLAGKLSFNPLHDFLTDSEGKQFKLAPPTGEPLPPQGYVFDDSGFINPIPDGSSVRVEVLNNSERLQLLEPFKPWDGEDYHQLPVLAKVKGKCTTDHISPAGPWLKYRGHLDKISDNMLLGAVNAFTGEIGKSLHPKDGKLATYAEIARYYKANNIGWVVIGDENYGEGSSREHAAMSPRYLGAKAVICRSLARIHETNLKKQGVLALRFTQASDYDLFKENYKLSLIGLALLAPGQAVKGIIHAEDGSNSQITFTHSFNEEQIQWWKAGSALNLVV